MLGFESILKSIPFQKHFKFYFRNERQASLVVDNGSGVFAESPGQLRHLDMDSYGQMSTELSGLFVGQ